MKQPDSESLVLLLVDPLVEMMILAIIIIMIMQIGEIFTPIMIAACLNYFNQVAFKFLMPTFGPFLLGAIEMSSSTLRRSSSRSDGMFSRNTVWRRGMMYDSTTSEESGPTIQRDNASPSWPAIAVSSSQAPRAEFHIDPCQWM